MKASIAGLSVVLSLYPLASTVAGQTAVRASLQSATDRKTAPVFRLFNASGKAISPSSYRGKVILLDFWATECGGCKAEIPYFIEFQRAYKSKGLAVLGVSLDVMYGNLKSANDGWAHVRPFVKEHNVNYPIVMGDDAVTKLYDIQAMPATYLIDKRGRVAATYVGIVDKADVDSNITTLLRER